MSTYLRYLNWKPQGRAMDLIHAVNEVIDDYEKRNLKLTIRQLHYRMLDKMDDYPNEDASYDRLVRTVSKGREAGLISWTAIEDRGRTLRGLGYQDHPHDMFKGLDEVYTRDKWADQPWRPEFWVEKQAQEGILAQVCNELQVDFFATKGYNSQSEQWKAGRRMADYIRKGQRPILFHLADLDPSGEDMTRDIRERVSLYAGTPVIVQRIALNINQVEEFNLPTNPSKDTDSRKFSDAWTHGDDCWEMDALDPAEIQAEIRRSVEMIIDTGKWEESLQREVEEKLYIQELISRLGIGADSDEDTE